MPRERVGVHVQQPALAIDTDAREDGHEAGGNEDAQQADVCVGIGYADSSEIDQTTITRPMRRRETRQRATRVGSRQTDCRHAGRVERRDEPRIDGAREHRHNDGQRRLVRDPEALNLTFRDAGALQCRVDFPAAAMDQHEMAFGCDARNRRHDRRQIRGTLDELSTELQYEWSHP